MKHDSPLTTSSNGKLVSVAPVTPRPYELPPLPPNLYYEDSPPKSAGINAATIIEKSDDFDFYTFALKKIIYHGRTAFQDVMIADTFNYGRALFLDGSIQSSEDDESLYHEMLVQPAMLRHPNPHDVLIIGGGEGATLREVLVHRSVKSVTMVDIDREVVELCREHLVGWHRGAFDDPRVRLIYDDGRKFLENDDAQYDVVIVDVVDMLDNGPAQALYTRQFYEMLRNRLRPDGIVVVQGLEFSFIDDKPHAALSRTLRTVFQEVHTYRVHVPSFLGSWGFLIASNWACPLEWTENEIERSILERLGIMWLDHISPEFLKAAFCLCKETQFLLSQSGPILEDGVDFIPPPNIEDIESTFVEFPIRTNE